jgi:predicted nuclease of predicted toxin-antitoxin system
MTFLLDNDVPDAIARVIQQAGHEARRLRELVPANTGDAAILAFAHARRALVVTCNRDHFLALAQQHPHAGIVILIRRKSRVAECSNFLRLLRVAGESGLRDNINFA